MAAAWNRQRRKHDFAGGALKQLKSFEFKSSVSLELEENDFTISAWHGHCTGKPCQ